MQVKKEKITVWGVKTKWNYVGTVRKKIETNYVTQFYIHRTIKGKKKGKRGCIEDPINIKKSFSLHSIYSYNKFVEYSIKISQ